MQLDLARLRRRSSGGGDTGGVTPDTNSLIAVATLSRCDLAPRLGIDACDVLGGPRTRLLTRRAGTCHNAVCCLRHDQLTNATACRRFGVTPDSVEVNNSSGDRGSSNMRADMPFG
jgi:hypothetical protein